MAVDTSQFRNGLKIELDGNPFVIIYFQHVKPGKGGAFVRTKVKNLLNGKVLDVQAIKALATLPSKDVMLAHLLSTINAVPTSFVRVLAEVPRSMLNVLTAIKDQKEAA